MLGWNNTKLRHFEREHQAGQKWVPTVWFLSTCTHITCSREVKCSNYWAMMSEYNSHISTHNPHLHPSVGKHADYTHHTHLFVPINIEYSAVEYCIAVTAIIWQSSESLNSGRQSEIQMYSYNTSSSQRQLREKGCVRFQGQFNNEWLNLL